ncbi:MULTISPECIES: thermonuclease family protein [Thermus]|jgi:micrococcal nuclease|uniref:thermonuclease family protein n=1 Tax=Thermus thalpophilus TaxID=2908147 RepID=UPI001FA9485A|nr:thermonuclease family protein [Thermus thalpophilus]
MLPSLRALLALPLLLTLALALSPQGKLQGPVRVVRVVDGDTVELQGLGPVRLIGIDAPESSYNQRTSGAEEVRLGLEAKAFLTRMLSGRAVYVELDVQERDRYRRVLAYLYLEDPRGDWSYGGKRFRQVNLELVRAGWAEPYTVPPNVRYAELYLQASRQARAKGLGMWGGGSGGGPRGGRSNCDPAYPTVCIPPPPPDLDCGEIPHRNFQVLPPDPHRFDRDRDGVGCER